MSVLICSTVYGGCGYVGNGTTFKDGGEDLVLCPTCDEDHAFQLTKSNLDDLTSDTNREKALSMLKDEENVESRGTHAF